MHSASTTCHDRGQPLPGRLLEHDVVDGQVLGRHLAVDQHPGRQGGAPLDPVAAGPHSGQGVAEAAGLDLGQEPEPARVDPEGRDLLGQDQAEGAQQGAVAAEGHHQVEPGGEVGLLDTHGTSSPTQPRSETRVRSSIPCSSAHPASSLPSSTTGGLPGCTTTPTFLEIPTGAPPGVPRAPPDPPGHPPGFPALFRTHRALPGVPRDPSGDDAAPGGALSQRRLEGGLVEGMRSRRGGGGTARGCRPGRGGVRGRSRPPRAQAPGRHRRRCGRRPLWPPGRAPPRPRRPLPADLELRLDHQHQVAVAAGQPARAGSTSRSEMNDRSATIRSTGPPIVLGVEVAHVGAVAAP